MCLNSHYRKQLVFSYDALEQAQTTLNKLRNRISNIPSEGDINKELFDKYNNKFIEEISNDLNTSNPISILYEVLKDNELNGNTKLELVNSFDKVFSVDLVKEPITAVVENETEILEQIEKRKEAKKNKDFALADQIRNELLAKGIELVDTREGATYRIIGE